MVNEEGIPDSVKDSSFEETRKLSPAAMEGLLWTGAPGTTRALRCWVPPNVEEVQRALPQYEVTGFIARGGMGAVYKGVQKALKRTVAIKILPAEIVDDDLDFVGRFKREAQSMAALSHPNIVTVFEAGETPDGLLYFTMEYIDGTDVGELVAEQGRLSPEEALRITIAVLNALECAHSRGIVHRDIKPSNVLINKQGEVKVADFGLAKVAAADGGLTQSVVTVGTPDFLAPETYVAGFPLDQRADVYSTGVMLYKMLTGRVPRGRFDAPSGEVRGMDPRLDRIIDKAMQEDREKRYATAKEMRSDLEEALSKPMSKTTAATLPGHKSSPAPAVRGNKGGVWIVVTGIAAAAAGFLVWWSQSAGTSASAESEEKEGIAIRREWRAAPAKYNAVMDDNAVHLQRLDTWGTSDLQIANVAVRTGIAWQPSPPGRNDLIKVTARWTDTEHYYACFYGPVVEVGYFRAPKIFPLQRWSVEPAPAPGEVISLQLACVGHHLAVWVRDRLVGVIDDDTLTGPGKVGVQAIDGHFRSLDYLDLDGLSAAEAYERLGLDPSGTSQTEAANAVPAVAKADRSNGEPWVDILQPDAAGKLQLYGIEKPGPDGLRVAANGKAIVAGTDKPGRGNGALRFRTRFEVVTKSRVSVRARYNKDGQTYALMALTPAKVALQIWSGDGGTKTLKDFALTSPLVPGQEYQLELRAVGATLTARLDGKTLGEVEDTTIPEGAFMIGLGAGQPVTVRALEYLDLSGPGSAVSTAAVRPSAIDPVTATKDALFVNSLGMKFVAVPITGGPTDRKRVLFSVWETRVQDYEIFAAESMRVWPKPSFEQGPMHPAVNITWQDAKAFCEWLTGREQKGGRLGATERYRLPMDHEWSCAVGIGEREDAAKSPEEKDRELRDVFPWGDLWPPPRGAGNYSGEEAAGHETWKDQMILTGYRDNFPHTAPVGSFSANDPGLFDLGGNAWEWCEELFKPAQTFRVMRGASFNNGGRGGLFSAIRDRHTPDDRTDSYGFRCVLDSSTQIVSASPISPVSWINVFPDLLKLPNLAEFTDGWARLAGNDGIRYIDDDAGNSLALHNGGVRVKRRVPEKWHGGVLLHVRSLEGGRRLNLCYYEPKAPGELAHLQLREFRPETLPPNATAAQAWDAQKLLAEQLIPPIGTEIITELVVVGTTLLGRVGEHSITCRVEDAGKPGRLAIDEANTHFFRDVEVIALDGMPEADALKLLGVNGGIGKPSDAFSSATPAEVSTARWRDALAESPLKEVIAKAGRTSQGYRLPDNHHWPISPMSHGTGALRVRATSSGEKFVSIYIDLGNQMVERVRFRSRDNKWLLSRGTAGPEEVDFAARSGFSPFDGQPHELLFARFGGRLRTTLDGQLIHDEADPSAADGTFVLDIYPGAEIVADKVEYLNLEGVPEAEALRLLGINKD